MMTCEGVGLPARVRVPQPHTKTLEDGLALCDLAADAGTAILFATPHVWPH